MASPFTVLYFRAILTYKPFWTCKIRHFLGPKIIPFKIKSIIKVAIIRLSVRPSEPCIYAIFRPTIFDMKLEMEIERFMLFNDYIFYILATIGINFTDQQS
jgi:hypothetical protein